MKAPWRMEEPDQVHPSCVTEQMSTRASLRPIILIYMDFSQLFSLLWMRKSVRWACGRITRDREMRGGKQVLLLYRGLIGEKILVNKQSVYYTMRDFFFIWNVRKYDYRRANSLPTSPTLSDERKIVCLCSWHSHTESERNTLKKHVYFLEAHLSITRARNDDGLT